MSSELEAQAEKLRQEQAALLAEREELERNNLSLQAEIADVGDPEDPSYLLKRIGEDIQDLHGENLALQQELLALDAENTLLRQTVNLPEGQAGKQVLLDTVAGLEALPAKMSERAAQYPGGPVTVSDNPEAQRGALRDEREELMAERQRLRDEAAGLCGDLQVSLRTRVPEGSENTPLVGVLEEYGNLCSNQSALQMENERLRKELEDSKTGTGEDAGDEETDQLRRELTGAMIKYAFLPPKSEVPPALRRLSKTEADRSMEEFKLKDSLQRLSSLMKPATFRPPRSTIRG